MPRRAREIVDYYEPEPTSGCWLWTGAIQSNGYGMFRKNGRMKPAHRVVFEVIVGPIGDGLVLDHLCRNRACVNPDHLRACTQRENILAPGSLSVTKINNEKTVCGNGHDLSEENVYRYPDGRRECRSCARVYKLKYKKTTLGKLSNARCWQRYARKKKELVP